MPAILVAAALAGGCAQPGGTGPEAPATGRDVIGPEAPATGRDVIGRESVTYAGEIPCADCPGQRLTLTLFTDSTFRLRYTYIDARDGKDQTIHDLGRWARAQDQGANRLRLAGAAEAPRRFLIRGDESLRLLDNEGREIRSRLNYDLKRLPQVDPVAGPMRLRGMYVYMADAAIFNECLTGKRFPVRLERNHVALERAYLAARRAPGEPLLVTFDGRFVVAAAEPGAPVREQVVVERFDRVGPGATCGPRSPAQAALLETYWRPVEIERKPVVIRPGNREPHFVLSAAGNSVRGFTGCNNLAGGFTQGADGFRFKALAATRMACLPESDLEARFLSALNATTSQQVVGETLELRDRDGTLRMRLEARYLK
jgi:copper homeostasis protein (lipoprotein)